ncbi:MAG TPA: hypothetical protein VMF89_30120, partial [Polyangiales bacterium]|nr:hypothetical protein [Polyangiales bacterium]
MNDPLTRTPNLENGADLYGTCAACHGQKGGGTAPLIRTFICLAFAAALSACASGEAPRQQAVAGERIYKVSC